jgi:hypothetical protein
MVEKINRAEKLKTEIAEHEKMIAEKSELSEMAASELPSQSETRKAFGRNPYRYAAQRSL